MNTVRSTLETTVVTRLVAALNVPAMPPGSPRGRNQPLMDHFASLYGEEKVALLQAELDCLSDDERAVVTSAMLDRVLQGRGVLFLHGL